MTKFEKIARNSIYFGPPGCGKSHYIEQILKENNIPKDNYFRVVFHPEYTHFDFVGSYRPVVGYRQSATVLYNGTQMAEPVTFYDFVPGPFALAITKALKVSENVVLVIEELNRGNCAAIFGSIFQLLDRDAEQKSKYDIILSPEWDTWHKKQLNITNTNPTQLKIPHNLWILATMNTSDQSLFPLDSAFKRRWEMVYMSGEQGDNPIQIPYNKKWIMWTNFREQINRKILQYTDNDDKQLGMWFFTPPETDIAQSFASKVLGYVWHEIPPSDRRKIFGDTYKSFGALYKAFLDGEEVFIQEMDLDVVNNTFDMDTTIDLSKIQTDVTSQITLAFTKNDLAKLPNTRATSMHIEKTEYVVGSWADCLYEISNLIYQRLHPENIESFKKDFLLLKKKSKGNSRKLMIEDNEFYISLNLPAPRIWKKINEMVSNYTKWQGTDIIVSYTSANSSTHNDPTEQVSTENISSPNEHSEE